MRAGSPPRKPSQALLAKDESREVRQVAMIDAQGRVAAHTGAKNIPAAGHVIGEQFSAQANMMLEDKVWPAMAAAFTKAKGDLAERMMAALDAAQAAGGDIRGQQSAALVVVTGKPTGQAWADRVFDLRVDDHAKPIEELRRLVDVQRAYNFMNAGDQAIERKDAAGASQAYSSAAETQSGQCRDALLARGGAREHGARGRGTADLQSRLRHGCELGRAGFAVAGGWNASFRCRRT